MRTGITLIFLSWGGDGNIPEGVKKEGVQLKLPCFRIADIGLNSQTELYRAINDNSIAVDLQGTAVTITETAIEECTDFFAGVCHDGLVEQPIATVYREPLGAALFSPAEKPCGSVRIRGCQGSS